MDEIPLVDEFVLIDSNSTDNTVAIAESHGILAYRHPEILPEEGSYTGKGEALWKSLHVLSGDIIAWVDTDITNIHPRFIYGLLGPLLKHPRIQYVKGFYQRPIKMGEKFQAYGGGRVTELVARPLLNLFYPELSGVVQPLSGEYAGRRAVLEQVPFFSGYGVETGLLLDLLERCGLDAIAQTDLRVRVHHNQPLVGLSKMSFAILQVFIARLEDRYGIELLEKASRSMKMIVQEPERLALEIAEIGDVERPPMITIPAYRNTAPGPSAFDSPIPSTLQRPSPGSPGR
jgi:glucosyl-3-phosphoglycerate synthase